MSWTAPQIRRQFLEFFTGKCGHTFVPSSPVVPHDDPTLLFTNAGMNQFKDVFLGRGTRPYLRAVNSQKCIRAGGKHNDLEDVGRDTYHHTFFEMLGNWSFGDYFKSESIGWGWELLTKVFGVAPDRLYATYFRGDPAAGLAPDHESRELWCRHLPPERVLPGSMKDNFWEMGETGPCGPCSEIHYDRIGGRDAAALVNASDPDVLEIWNHVFIQFNREAGGELRALPARHVDTGMGFERLVSVLQDKRSNYDTDVWSPIFAAIRKRTGARAYAGVLEDPIDIAYRVIADHVRCVTVALTDGAVPGNEGRGYVLRRILRRAVRHGHQTLGMREPFLADLVPAVVETLGEAFPELRARPDRVAGLIRDEEAAFGRTIERGLTHFAEAAQQAVAAGAATISGRDAFKLHDTYGFPIDLTQVMAEERSLRVDIDGYESLMDTARQTSRRVGESEDTLTPGPDTLEKLRRIGVASTADVDKYHARPVIADVLAIWNGRELVEDVPLGELAAIILNRTNCYAEQGGQVADHGTISVEGGHDDGDASRGGSFQIEDVRRVGEWVLHIGRVTDGRLRRGQRTTVRLDRDRRDSIRANHTATHLLNHALRDVLGEDVQQRGSLVDGDRLRFDFTCSHAVEPAQLDDVERRVNHAIHAGLEVFTEIVPLERARGVAGLRAVFGERYPDPVRVVSIGAAVSDLLADPSNPRWQQYSIEFCGGTHLERTTEAKHVVILSEAGLSAGVRRIQAVTGLAAKAAERAGLDLETRAFEARSLSDEQVVDEFTEVSRLADELTLGAASRRRLSVLLDKLRDRVKAARRKQAESNRGSSVEQARAIAGRANGRVIVDRVEAADRDALLAALDAVRATRPDAAVMLFGADEAESRVTIVAGVPKELIGTGLKAGDWVREAAQACGGSGGGRPDSAQAGGKDPSRVPEAIAKAAAFAATRVG